MSTYLLFFCQVLFCVFLTRFLGKCDYWCLYKVTVITKLIILTIIIIQIFKYNFAFQSSVDKIISKIVFMHIPVYVYFVL